MSRVLGATLLGVDGLAIEVEVRISSQLPRVDIVGLPAASVRESAARVRAAIASVGLRFPDRRVTVNLAPAEKTIEWGKRIANFRADVAVKAFKKALADDGKNK